MALESWERAKERAKEARERPVRQQIGHERPGTVLRGPPITVTCECGETRELAYGEAWRCERCGRRYDTANIPREDYERIRRTQLRFRLLPASLGVLVSLVALFFILSGNTFSLLLLLPISLLMWFMLLRPVHRKRYRAAIADLPQWNLRADRGGA